MSDAVQVTREFAKYLITLGIPVKEAFIFGSYAKGTSNAYSDIDVCIVSPVFGKNNFDEMLDLRKKSLKIDTRLEPVAFSPEDLKDPYSTLALEIRKYGVSVPLE